MHIDCQAKILFHIFVYFTYFTADGGRMYLTNIPKASIIKLKRTGSLLWCREESKDQKKEKGAVYGKDFTWN